MCPMGRQEPRLQINGSHYWLFSVFIYLFIILRIFVKVTTSARAAAAAGNTGALILLIGWHQSRSPGNKTFPSTVNLSLWWCDLRAAAAAANRYRVDDILPNSGRVGTGPSGRQSKKVKTCKVWESVRSLRDSASWPQCLPASDSGCAPACGRTLGPSKTPVLRWRSSWGSTRGIGRRCRKSTAPKGTACRRPLRRESPPISDDKTAVIASVR